MKVMETNSPLTRMKELSSSISAWKMALKFGGSQDREFNEFCKNNISKLGNELVQVAKSVKRAAAERKLETPRASFLKKLLGCTKWQR